MKVTSEWTGGMGFTATNLNGQQMQMDATEKAGGEGKGVSPMEAVLGGLSGCMGIDMMMVLRRYQENIQSLTFEMEGERNDGPPNYFTSIDMVCRVEGDVPADRVWRAIHLSDEKYCSVRHSLKADVTYRLILNGEEVPENK